MTLAVSVLATALPAATAADRRDHRDHQEVRRNWHGDIRTFHQHDLDRWRRGHWQHGYHNGRLGWWWVVPSVGLWYLYSQPAYPYPDPYVPPVQYWYYCESAKAYCPYVPSCPEGWKTAPAVPAQ